MHNPDQEYIDNELFWVALEKIHDHPGPVLEDLDAPALVGVLGLYEPYVLVTVLHRRALLPGVALGNLLEAIDERIQARIRQAQVHKIGGRRRIKDGVVGCSGLLVCRFLY